MPRTANDASNRIEIRVPSDQKAMITRAAAIEHTDLTGFILRAVLPEAQAVIDRSEHLVLSERDSLHVLDLLENPPEPSTLLVRAAKLAR